MDSSTPWISEKIFSKYHSCLHSINPVAKSSMAVYQPCNVLILFASDYIRQCRLVRRRNSNLLRIAKKLDQISY